MDDRVVIYIETTHVLHPFVDGLQNLAMIAYDVLKVKRDSHLCSKMIPISSQDDQFLYAFQFYFVPIIYNIYCMETYAPFPPEPIQTTAPQQQQSGSGAAKAVEDKLGMTVVPQTKVAFVGYVLLTLVMVLHMLKNPGASMQYLPNLVVYVIIFLISLYVINCTVVGKCNLYAWIVSYVVVVLGILAVVGVILALAK